MNQPAFKPLLNTSLPHGFRYVRLERARDHHHPDGDGNIAYVLIAPLTADGRLDPDLWRKHKEACRVARKRPNSEDILGHLVHGSGGSWRFHYDLAGTIADEAGDHFNNERFEAGEYVSVHEADGSNVYRVVSVLPL